MIRCPCGSPSCCVVRSASVEVIRSSPSSGPVTSVSRCGSRTSGRLGCRSAVERYPAKSSGGCTPEGRSYAGQASSPLPVQTVVGHLGGHSSLPCRLRSPVSTKRYRRSDSHKNRRSPAGHAHVPGGSSAASASARAATRNARLAAGTPAYTATWSRTSRICSGLRPLRNAALTCRASSSSCVQGGQHGQRDDAPLGPRQAGPGPDLAPGVAGDEVLERLGERGSRCRRAVDVRVSRYLPPDRHPLPGPFGIIHDHSLRIVGPRTALLAPAGPRALGGPAGLRSRRRRRAPR